ncbi:MAG: transposase [Pirellulaceae bacterium]|nr:transposase [Pirellulaceae bacterium]
MNKSKKSRRSWSSSVKMRIVLKGMEPGVDIAALCRQEGVSPTQYYSWKKQLVSSAEAVFGDKRSPAIDAKEARLSAELTRMKGVVAEITAENLELKKTL